MAEQKKKSVATKNTKHLDKNANMRMVATTFETGFGIQDAVAKQAKDKLHKLMQIK